MIREVGVLASLLLFLDVGPVLNENIDVFIKKMA
jgi:hypothetical protein